MRLPKEEPAAGMHERPDRQQTARCVCSYILDWSPVSRANLRVSYNNEKSPGSWERFRSRTGGLFRCGDFLQISFLVVFSLGSSFEIVTILQNVKDSAE